MKLELPHETDTTHDFPGMSLRDYFAGQALLGTVVSRGHNRALNHIAQVAYEIADAMIAERDQ